MTGVLFCSILYSLSSTFINSHRILRYVLALWNLGNVYINIVLDVYPPQTSGVLQTVSVLENREDAVFKRMEILLHLLQTVHCKLLCENTLPG